MKLSHAPTPAKRSSRRVLISASITNMDPDSWWRRQWPLGVLLFGLLMLLLAVIGTFTGKLYGRGGVVDRAEDPSNYRLTLLVQYLCAAAHFVLALRFTAQDRIAINFKLRHGLRLPCPPHAALHAQIAARPYVQTGRGITDQLTDVYSYVTLAPFCPAAPLPRQFIGGIGDRAHQNCPP